MKTGCITKLTNCHLLRGGKLVEDDLWIRNGKIIDPEKLFYGEKKNQDEIIDCNGGIVTPGFIDVQINGGFGIDFSYDIHNIQQGISKVSKGVLAHGVTSFCPTLVSSSPTVYQKVLGSIKKSRGGLDGAEILGVHVEGPFINKEKRGAHDASVLQVPSKGYESLKEIYGNMDSVSIITLAPELPGSLDTIHRLKQNGIVVSLGHSMASISEGEEGVRLGATFITHLFNAMLPFHHRDPGLVGLLSSDKIGENRLFYGLIADGNHTHPTTIRIAYRANPDGVVLVTDACSAMGLTNGTHHIGQQVIQLDGTKALIQGTNTLCGSVATMISCIQYFQKTTGCSIVEALEAATLHPAQLLGIQESKGTLDFGSDADFVILAPEEYNVKSTWIDGICVYKNSNPCG